MNFMIGAIQGAAERRKAVRFLMLAVSALLTGLCIVIPKLGLIEWITLVPAAIVLILTARNGDVKYKKMYFYGFVYYMSFGLSIFHWFIRLYPLSFIDGMTDFEAAVVVASGWIGLSLLQAVFAAFMPVLLALILRKGIIK